MRKILKYRVFPALIVVTIVFSWSVFSGCELKLLGLGEKNKSQQDSTFSSTKITQQEQVPAGTQKVTFQIHDLEDLDGKVEEYLLDLYPIISEKDIAKIQATRDVTKKLIVDTLGIMEFYLNIFVPKHFLAERPEILWELNIPEFQSRIFQIYNNDTFLIDVWPNVVGKPSTKTYTGYYQAFRLRNWPFWKDPDSPDSVRPTPPGPNNPLGLFVVHYDENSLRYFHGTNKNYLLKNEYRALSHGCVRNDNANIKKMKEFIIKKIIKADDLSFWLDSKKSMIYEIKEEDRFPVRIIYKLFEVDEDDHGIYVIFFKDIYGYARGSKWSRYDKPELMTFISTDNIINEFKKEFSTYYLPYDKIIPIIETLVSSHKDYEKYYISDYLGSETGK
jgi:hypothetical protein